MHENHNLLLFLIEINNMHHTRHILPIPSPNPRSAVCRQTNSVQYRQCSALECRPAWIPAITIAHMRKDA